ncbi:MAG: hypothetical protein ABEJ72_00250 [Candidatus Aenigmatarchaeota archaeon]
MTEINLAVTCISREFFGSNKQPVVRLHRIYIQNSFCQSLRGPSNKVKNSIYRFYSDVRSKIIYIENRVSQVLDVNIEKPYIRLFSGREKISRDVSYSEIVRSFSVNIVFSGGASYLIDDNRSLDLSDGIAENLGTVERGESV